MAKRKAKRKSASGAPKPEISRLQRPLPLTAQVERALRKSIEAGAFPGDRLPTTVELAEQLGVSRETVRLAMEALQREGLLVKHRRRGTFVRPPEVPGEIVPVSKIVGYLQADYSGESGGGDVITRNFSSCMFDGALVEAGNAGYQMVARSARIADLRRGYEELVAQVRLAGVIFASVAEEKLVRRLSGRNVPVVLMDHDLHVPKVSSIQPDSFARGKMAVQHLAEIGHRRIALAQWHQQDLNPWLLRGYREGMRDAGLMCRRKWELFVPITPAGGREVVETIADMSPRPTAVICFSNALANFVCDAAFSREIRVPVELSVIGGGGGDVVGLTCTQVDWYELGRSAMRLLLDAIEAGDEHEARHELVPYELTPGRTTCRIE